MADSFVLFNRATAYFGLLDLAKPKEGDTVVISGAGGAVGSHVGQIAKIKGCKAIGITGSDEKGKWLVNELGCDACVNYKSPSFAQELKQVVPDGIDIYFDNVNIFQKINTAFTIIPKISGWR